jgi:rhodanese-related sulfurtransferase
MKKFVFLCLFFGSNQLIGQSYTYEQMLNLLVKKTVTPIKIKDAKLIKNAYFFDTRAKKEFEVSHIDNAQWIGYEEFKIGKLKNIPKNAEIILYCSVGARSEQIGEKLLKAGFKNVRNLWGGIFEWVNDNNLIVGKNNKPTTKVHAYSPEWGIWLQKGEKVYN